MEQGRAIILNIIELFGLNDEDFIIQTYLSFLDRYPDINGLRFYLGLLANGHTREDIIYRIYKSPERKQPINILGIEKLIKQHGSVSAHLTRFIRKGFAGVIGCDRSKSIRSSGFLGQSDMHLTDHKLFSVKQNTNNEEYKVIARSGLFDWNYYVRNNPDVLEAGEDALDHYCLHGWRELRNPSDRFDTKYYLEARNDVRNSGANPLYHYIKDGRKEGQLPSPLEEVLVYNDWVKKYARISRRDISCMTQDRCDGPLISFVMSTYNSDIKFLKLAIESILNQTYNKIELCISDDFSDSDQVRECISEYGSIDARVKFKFRKERGHICASSNSAINLAAGDYIAFVDHDDIVAQHAAYHLAHAIMNSAVKPNLLYSDEDKISDTGDLVDPYFKADFDPFLLLHQNYFGHLTCINSNLLNKLNGLRVGFEGSQDYDLVLRAVEIVEPKTIVHIPHVLYHWRKHEQHSSFSTQYQARPDEVAHQALMEHAYKKCHSLQISKSRVMPGCWDVGYLLPDVVPSVSIIIPTRDKASVLKKCINSILKSTEYPNYVIVIVDNNSQDKETYEYYQSLISGDVVKVRILYDKGSFNYSRLNNYAAKQSSCDVIVFLNNDTEIVNKNWLYNLVSLSSREDVGAVGAKLLYPNGTIQHLGVALGVYGAAGHIFRGRGGREVFHFGYSHFVRRVSAVTGACLAVRKKLFDHVGGFDESFAVSFNDVDLCLRIAEEGYYNLLDARTSIVHHESLSRGLDDTSEKKKLNRNETRRFISRYVSIINNDPCYNQNFSLDSEDVTLTSSPRVSKPWYFNEVDMLVPFHRGDILVGVMAAFIAVASGIKVRFHVAEELSDIVLAFSPPFDVYGVPVAVPDVAQTIESFRIAAKYVVDRNDFSGFLVKSHTLRDYRDMGLNIIENLLRQIGLPIDSEVIPEEICKNLGSFNKSENLSDVILLHPNGGWQTKSLPQQLVENIVTIAHKKKIKVIQVGASEDKVFECCDGHLLGADIMPRIASALLGSLGLICVDSFLSHLAVILGIDRMILYGPTHPEFIDIAYRKSNKIGIRSVVTGPFVSCSPCDSICCPKNLSYCESFDSPEMILQVERFIENISLSKR